MRPRRHVVLIPLVTAVVLALHAGVPESSAQEEPASAEPVERTPFEFLERVEPEDRILRLHPLLPPVRIRTTVGVESEFSDNFFQTERNEESEFRTSAVSTINAKMEGPRGFLDLGYGLRRTFHSRFSELDDFLHSATLNAGYQLTRRLSLALTDSFVRSDDPVAAGPLGLRRGRSLFLRNVATPQLAYQAGPQTEIILRDTYTLVRNDDPARDDSDGNSVALELRTASREVRSFSLGYEFTTIDSSLSSDVIGHRGNSLVAFPLSRVTAATLDGEIRQRDLSRGTDFLVYAVRGGLLYQPERDLKIEGGVGVESFLPEEGGDSLFVTFVVGATADFSQSRLRGSVRRSVTETFLEADNLGVFRSLQGSLSYEYFPSPEWLIRLNGSVAQNETLQVSGLAGSIAGREDLVFHAGIDVTYQATRWLAITGGYFFEDRDSNIDGLSFTENRFLLNLTLILDVLR